MNSCFGQAHVVLSPPWGRKSVGILFVLGFLVAVGAVDAQTYQWITLAGNAGYGSANGAGTNASFHSPSSVAADASNNVYVADTDNHLIRIISPAGVVATFA